MFEKMKWEDVYKLWKADCYRFSDMLSSPVSLKRYSKNISKKVTSTDTTGFIMMK